jgi:CBS domain-containing protein
MTTAQDIMTPAPQCVRHDQTLVDAARMMATMDVGSLPICGPEGKLVGMLTDRDIVVRCLAAGDDPSAVTAGELAEGKPTYVAADADISEVLRVMQEQQIRRVPVIEDRQLVGIISQGDISLSAAPSATGETVAQISQ